MNIPQEQIENQLVAESMYSDEESEEYSRFGLVMLTDTWTFWGYNVKTGPQKLYQKDWNTSLRPNALHKLDKSDENSVTQGCHKGWWITVSLSGV